MNLDDDVERIGLEVEPAGPYAVLRPPWYVKPLPAPRSDPSPWRILERPYVLPGVRFTAVLERMTGRVSCTQPLGRVHLRAFDWDGRMLWSGTYARMEIPSMTITSSGRGEIELDLLPPFELKWNEHRP